MPDCVVGNYRLSQKSILCKSDHEGAATGYRLNGAGLIERLSPCEAVQVCVASGAGSRSKRAVRRRGLCRRGAGSGSGDQVRIGQGKKIGDGHEQKDGSKPRELGTTATVNRINNFINYFLVNWFKLIELPISFTLRENLDRLLRRLEILGIEFISVLIDNFHKISPPILSLAILAG